MSKAITIRKGVDIKLKGLADKIQVAPPLAEVFSIRPTDFHGLTPKLSVKEKDEVKAGSVLFYDKSNPDVKIVSPVSGEVVEIKRGEKRRILEIKILADKEIRYLDFPKVDDVAKLSREQVLTHLLNAGLFPFIKQRPFDVMADPKQKPKSIHITGFDSSPLAPDYDYIAHGHGDIFQKGLDAVAKLTDGKIHLNLRSEQGVSKVFSNSKGVQINYIDGPHPAGNVGVQIHHIEPISKGQVIWTLSALDVLTIGKYFAAAKFDASRLVAVCGSSVDKPKYYKTYFGASIKNLLDAVKGDNNRYISGNPLTGDNIGKDGFLGFYHHQLTVLPEGNEAQFLGWLTPNTDKFSISRTFLSWLTPSKEYSLNTNMNGEYRNFVMTGQYESVFPFDIYPVHLVKSIMIGDFEQMENLGIYEVSPEDFALCEYVCTSKIDVQSIVREGLDVVKKECA